MQNNRIKSLAIGLFIENINLATLNFENNICISDKATDKSQVKTLIEKMYFCYKNYAFNVEQSFEKCEQDMIQRNLRCDEEKFVMKSHIKEITKALRTCKRNCTQCLRNKEEKIINNDILNHWLFNLFFGFWD
jgi:hypothetical protein